jgi:CheY-like chemotaxis protein
MAAEVGKRFGPIKPAELSHAIRGALGAQQDARLKTSPKPMTEVQSCSRLRILAAEDNLINQKLIVALLNKMGHEVTLAANGVEALSKWKAGAFEMIFMDVQMPEMDGFEATRQIRLQEKATGSNIPMIAMTAHAMASTCQSGETAEVTVSDLSNGKVKWSGVLPRRTQRSPLSARTGRRSLWRRASTPRKANTKA